MDEAAHGLMLTTPKLVLLLGDQVVLGYKNTRVTAMDALVFVAAEHHKLIRNSLVKNRG